MKQKVIFYIVLFLFLTAAFVPSVIDRKFKRQKSSQNAFPKENASQVEFPKTPKLEIKSLPLTPKYSLPIIKSEIIPLWADYLKNLKLIKGGLESLSGLSFQETNKWKEILASLDRECRQAQEIIGKALGFSYGEKQERFLSFIKNKNAIFLKNLGIFTSLINKGLTSQQEKRKRLEEVKNFLSFLNILKISFNQIAIQNQKLNQIVSQINNLTKSGQNKEIFSLITNLKKENRLLADKIEKFRNNLNFQGINKNNSLLAKYTKIKEEGDKLCLNLLNYSQQLDIISNSLELTLKRKEGSYSGLIYDYKKTIRKTQSQILEFKKELPGIKESLGKENSGKELKDIKDSLAKVYFSFSDLIKAVNSFQESL